MELFNVNYATASGMANVYSMLYYQSQQKQRTARLAKNFIVRHYGISKNTLLSWLNKFEAAGLIVPVEGSFISEYEIKDIKMRQPVQIVEGAENEPLGGAENEPPGSVAEPPGARTEPPKGAVTEPPGVQGLNPYSNSYNNTNNNIDNKETPGSFLDLPSVNQENLPPSKPTKGKLDKELLSLINEHIPEKWPRLTVLTASRKKVLEAIWSGNGGRSWFIEKFPIVMQALKVDEFWSGNKADYGKFRPPSFDGFFGSNTKTPKDHFVHHLERGTEITTKEQVLLTKRQLWHPHFRPPAIRPFLYQLVDDDSVEGGFLDRGDRLMKRLDNPPPDDQYWEQYKDAVIYYSKHPDGIKAEQ